MIISKAIMVQFDNRLQSGLEQGPLGWVDLDLENGILHPLTEVAASFGHAAQPLGAISFSGIYVIGHKYHHGEKASLPEPRGVGIKIPAQMPRQQLGLQIGDET